MAIRAALDPGHGGHELGAVYNGITEKTWALDFCRYLAARVKHGAEPFEVTLLRNFDTAMSLKDRGITSKALGADIVLSVHVNAHKKDYMHGAMCFYWPGNSVGRVVADTIARSVPNPLYRGMGRVWEATDDPTPDDDWLQRPRDVLQPHAATAVLLEVGYCSNPADSVALLDPAVQHGLAVACEAGLAEARRLLAKAA